MVRSRECRLKLYSNLNPDVNPQFALDMPTYNKITDVHSFYPKVIHATYFHSDSPLEGNPEI